MIELQEQNEFLAKENDELRKKAAESAELMKDAEELTT